MNIFILDKNPIICATYHCDKHVVKMIVESCQLLCNGLRNFGINEEWMYKETHKNHPCSKWVLKDINNFDWLLILLRELLFEYDIRYGLKNNKIHKCYFIYKNIKNAREKYSKNLILYDYKRSYNFNVVTDNVIENQTSDDNTVKLYRQYYFNKKYDICKWTTRDVPLWWRELEYVNTITSNLCN